MLHTVVAVLLQGQRFLASPGGAVRLRQGQLSLLLLLHLVLLLCRVVARYALSSSLALAIAAGTERLTIGALSAPARSGLLSLR